jgi:hypothetical protein
VIATLHDPHATAPRGPSVWLEHLTGLPFVDATAWKWALVVVVMTLAVYVVVRVALLVATVAGERLGRF